LHHHHHHHCIIIIPLLASDMLEAVAIERAVVTRGNLAFLVDSFPRPTSLSLDRCVFESLEPLVDAYRLVFTGG
jgi:hypothetical protein